VQVWRGVQKGWEENPPKDGLIGLIILDRYFPTKGKKSLRTVPPGRQEFRSGSSLGEFKLPSPAPSASAPDAMLKDVVGSGVLGGSSCS